MTAQALVTVKEVATQLKVTPEALLAAADVGQIPKFVMRGETAFQKVDLPKLAAVLAKRSASANSSVDTGAKSAAQPTETAAGRKAANETDILGMLSDEEDDDDDVLTSGVRRSNPASKPALSPRPSAATGRRTGTIRVGGADSSDSGLFPVEELERDAVRGGPKPPPASKSGPAMPGGATAVTAPAKAPPKEGPALGLQRPRLTQWPMGLVSLTAEDLGSAADVMGGLAATTIPGSTAIPVGKDRVTFLESALVDTMKNVTRVVNSPTKHPIPVLQPDTPWEHGGQVGLGGSVFYEPDEGVLKMWYTAVTKTGRVASLATSTDGLNWTKPRLGLVKIDGADTNIVMAHPQVDSFADLAGVIRDDSAEPNAKYKAVFLYQNAQTAVKALKTAVSPDGVHWTAGEALLQQANDVSRLTRDPRTGRFIIYARLMRQGRRCIQRIDSEDFVFWSGGEPILEPDSADPAGDDLYCMGVFPYGRGFVGLLQMYHGPPNFNLDVQLAYSTDGWKWERYPERTVMLPMGSPGAWDRHQISPSDRPVVIADRELWFYYGGRVQRHPPYSGPDRGTAWGAIGVASLRIDGMAHVESSFDPGTLVTQPLLFSGKDLHLNCNSCFGHLQVHLLDAEYRPIDGMLSKPIVVDSTNYVVQWANPRPLTHWKDRLTRLRFTLKNAKLYSFWSE